MPADLRVRWDTYESIGDSERKALVADLKRFEDTLPVAALRDFRAEIVAVMLPQAAEELRIAWEERGQIPSLDEGQTPRGYTTVVLLLGLGRRAGSQGQDEARKAIASWSVNTTYRFLIQFRDGLIERAHDEAKFERSEQARTESLRKTWWGGCRKK